VGQLLFEECDYAADAAGICGAWGEGGWDFLLLFIKPVFSIINDCNADIFDNNRFEPSDSDATGCDTWPGVKYTKQREYQ
jgi:hypothetical protein